ncbi:MAG: flagellar biosynthesis protein FlhA [SAR324 cluster bacterium]|uniref:Flagellar biosynthesis protein FlhA n=1 Tax=SAR324 cluster bacterium TaxID=2024889 RepID=A0A7X9FPY9_9DELT|nr:flagellar biosynthesis protein FlhA [SAR324 cluster bacterium]
MALPVKTLKKEAWQNFIIPVALVAILTVLLFPIPTWLLDIALALNITIALIILFVSLQIEKPLKFSSYPAVLLVTTLFRLSLSIASARLILLHGEEGTSAAGHIIQAFGEFVVGGNFVVGCVIFIIISIVNLKVVTKGSGRIAEVAARFTLDAMPGKQMAIDSDLNTGIIGEAEARERRKELAQEAEFYGSMDGAAKFVSGDAIASIMILGINVVGGFFIGIIQKNMDWSQAAQIYTLLTVGDGLVSQIPALIISISAGLIVARAGTGDDLSLEVVGQLSKSSKAFFLTSATCAGLALIPGLPFLPFMLLGGATGAMGLMKQKSEKLEASKALLKLKTSESEENAGKPKPGSTEEVLGLLGIDTLELEVGYELVSLVEGGELVDRIRSLRRQFAMDYGFIVSPIHIRDNVRINPCEYRLLLRGALIGKGELKSHHYLAMDPGTVTQPLHGIPTKEPAFGLDAIWITEADKERAQYAGYTVVDLATVVVTHLTELIRSNMHELLGRQETQQLIDAVMKDNPKVVEELIPGLLTLGQVQQVLQHLLREQVSIRDLKTVLETLADWAPTVKNVEQLAEFCRKRLARTITEKFLTNEGILPLTSLTPNLERSLSEAVQHSDEGSYLALEPSQAQMLITRLNSASERFAELGQTPLILAPSHLRAALSRFVDRFVPGYAVISHNEIAPSTRVQSLGVISAE